MTNRPRALMGLQFFPRGGSAHVAQNLARALPQVGWDVGIASGSVRIPGRPGDAREFYAGLDVHPVDMTAALAAADPMLADPPMHPSYEDRPGQADRVFCALDDATFEHHARVWARELERAGAHRADVLHLHHLTPLNAAARRVAPTVPIVGHLHGTELLMLEEAESGTPWPHVEKWRRRMRAWAHGCRRLIVLSESQVERAERLLEIDPRVCVQVPNGFEPETFDLRVVDRAAFWRRHLVEEPRGWLPGGEPGSLGYGEADLAPFGDGNPVLLYVGRYTAVKRIALLIEAYAEALPLLHRRAPLVLLGGFPGEWEGEHPAETVRRTGVADVFLAGWHGHDELPGFFAASDAVVLPSVREQFGQVLVEGMACGLPAVAVDAFGPREIVEHGRTGWLVPPDDREALAAALVEVVNEPSERAARGAAARAEARDRYAWPALAREVAQVYDEARSAPGPRS